MNDQSDMTDSPYYIEPEARGAPAPRRRRRRLLRGGWRNWAVAAGLACLGSFLPSPAASAGDIVIIGGGGGGGGATGSTNLAGTGGAAASYTNPQSQVINGMAGGDGSWGLGIEKHGGGGGGGLLLYDGATTYTTAGGDGGLSTGGTNRGSPGQGADDWLFGLPGDPGGDGGDYSTLDGGAGGNGGSGNFNNAVELSDIRNLAILGGNAGDAGEEGEGVPGEEANGGDGGNVGVTATTGEVSLTGEVVVRAGLDGADTPAASGGAGGWAALTLGALRTAAGTGDTAQIITVGGTGDRGESSIELRKIHVDTADLAIILEDLEKTTASFGDLLLAKDRRISTDQADYTQASYTASGNIDVLGDNTQLNMNYDASDKILTFAVNSDVASNTVMMTVGNPNTLTINDATTVKLEVGDDFGGTNLLDPAALNRADRSFTLVANIKDTSAGIEDQQSDWLNYSLFSYQFQYYTEADNLMAELTGLRLNNDTKALLEGGPAVRTMLLNIRQDYVAGALTRNLIGLTGSTDRLQVFASNSFDHQRGKTGGYVDLDAYSLAAGLGRGISAGAGRLTVAAFFEGGWGDYDSRHRGTAVRFKGDGDASYMGGGALVRYDLCNGFNFEASLSMGRVKSDFRSAQLPDGRFDSSTFYWGGHLGLGKVFDLGQRSRLEPYAKVLYTRQSKDSDIMSGGARVRFDAVFSVRSRLGLRYSYSLSECVELYADAAWEHEFKARDKGTINGMAIRPTTSLKGHTGLAELGAKWRINDNWDAGASVRGLIGKRRGVGGNVTVGYSF